MPSIAQRNQILRECWIDARYRVPDPLEAGPHFSVEVLGIVDDPAYTVRGERPFVDIVAYWPAAKRFTVTHCGRGCAEVEDRPVNVTHWQSLPPLAWVAEGDDEER